MTSPESESGGDRPLQFPAFRWYLLCQTLVTLAVQMQNTVVAYQMYVLTGDVLSLGLLGLAEAVPAIALAVFGGHVADRFDRRRIALIVLCLMTAAALLLMLLSHTRASWSVPQHQTAIYGLVVFGGICRGFLQPARVALGAQLVPRRLYPRAIAWRTGSFQLASILGPALGGVAYAWLGGTGAYAIAAVFMATGWFAMYRIQVPLPPPQAQDGPATSMFSSIREGFTFLLHEPVLLPALALDLFAVLFGGATALLPVFAKDILHVGAQGFGALRAAPAVGALVAVAVLARFPIERAGRAILLAAGGFGACMIGFAVSRWYLVSLVLLASSGGLDMISVVVRSTLLQLRVPIHLLGRVSSINQIFIGSSNEIGAFESGVAARLLGTVRSVVLGGVVTLLVVATTAYKAPALRKLGRLSE
jgi:MFS family permease